MEPDSQKPKTILYRDTERIVVQFGAGGSQVYSFEEWAKLESQLRGQARARVIPFPVPGPR